MEIDKMKAIIEAILFASGRPVEIKELISDKLADIEVDVTGLNDEDATTRIVDAIYGYYGL